MSLSLTSLVLSSNSWFNSYVCLNQKIHNNGLKFQIIIYGCMILVLLPLNSTKIKIDISIFGHFKKSVSFKNKARSSPYFFSNK